MKGGYESFAHLTQMEMQYHVLRPTVTFARLHVIHWIDTKRTQNVLFVANSLSVSQDKFALLKLQDEEAWTILKSINKHDKSHECAALRHKSAS